MGAWERKKVGKGIIAVETRVPNRAKCLGVSGEYTCERCGADVTATEAPRTRNTSDLGGETSSTRVKGKQSRASLESFLTQVRA